MFCSLGECSTIIAVWVKAISSSRFDGTMSLPVLLITVGFLGASMIQYSSWNIGEIAFFSTLTSPGEKSGFGVAAGSRYYCGGTISS